MAVSVRLVVFLVVILAYSAVLVSCSDAKNDEKKWYKDDGRDDHNGWPQYKDDKKDEHHGDQHGRRLMSANGGHQDGHHGGWPNQKDGHHGDDDHGRKLMDASSSDAEKKWKKEHDDKDKWKKGGH